MRVCESIKEIREMLGAVRRSEVAIGFVPTMGALHEGHLSLVRLAREKVGPEGIVVVSIFVNPTQFAPHEDFESYPRMLDSDLECCRAEGVDLIFLPPRNEVYAEDASVRVVEEQLSQGLCGASRPHFFGGVCTVVAKLFNIVQPGLAVFGEKDFQQLAVIRRMVRDLNFSIEIVGGPIAREADGIAMSSRNKYLTAEERQQATVLNEALKKASEAMREGERDAAKLVELTNSHIETAPAARIDYVEVVDPDSLENLSKVERQALIAVAVFFGNTRLIDNVCLRELSE